MTTLKWKGLWGDGHEQELIVDPVKVKAFCAKQSNPYKGIKPYTSREGYKNNGELLVFKKDEQNLQMLNYFANNGELLPEILAQIT